MSGLDSFRAEARGWMEANAPRSLFGTRRRGGLFDGFWGGQKARDPDRDLNRWCASLAERGWNAPRWPEAYGGGGLGRAEAAALEEVMVELDLPRGLFGFGLAMLGPALLQFGDEAQKREHLPKICDGTIRWCQGYSEPGAGSDLAALATRAVRDGDHFVIDGQKVWTSYADKSDWIFCLVRTDPEVKKQRGISFVLFDMDDPGVTVRPIELISGASPFCEVFFDGVRVPVANVVGGVDNGWTVAKALLQHERANIGAAIGSQMSALEGDLVEVARDAFQAPEGPLPDALLRDEIVRGAMLEQCFNLTVERIAQGTRAGQAPGPDSSILKVCGSELKQQRWETQMRIAGPAALGWAGPGYDDRELEGAREWLRSRGNSIEGGTSEIQLNIIAKHVLGL